MLLPEILGFASTDVDLHCKCWLLAHQQKGSEHSVALLFIVTGRWFVFVTRKQNCFEVCVLEFLSVGSAQILESTSRNAL